MNRYNFSIFILLVFYSCKNEKQTFPILNLSNEGILKISDSVKLNLDSSTTPNTDYIYLIDTFLYICNTEANFVSKININTNVSSNILINFKRFGKPQKFSSIWIDKSKFYCTQNLTKKGFVFDNNGVLVDSFQLAKTNNINHEQIITENSLISPIQPLLFTESTIYSLGFALDEGNITNDNLRFVLSGTKRKSNEFFVNYPKNYKGKNWGGTYLRMVYGTNIGDSIMVISFPASNELALFNGRTKSTQYINCYPSIDSVVTPVGSIKEVSKKQTEIAKHFFKQYSFQAIIFDKYRNIYYRFLNKPIPIDRHNEISVGNLNIQILVYDNKFKYLGYSEIKGSLYSNRTYLVHPRGLLIKKLKNIRDEEHIYFDLFTLDSNFFNSLPTR